MGDMEHGRLGGGGWSITKRRLSLMKRKCRTAVAATHPPRLAGTQGGLGRGSTANTPWKKGRGRGERREADNKHEIQ